MLQEKVGLSRFGQHTTAVVFVGDHSSFSDLYLRLIQEEFPDYLIVWDPRITDAQHRVASLRDKADVIVISCKFGASVLPAISRFSTSAPNARFVLAYDTLEDVRAVMETVDDLKMLQQFSFLPMRSKIETSIFVLHLLHSGERHFSAELMQLVLDRHRQLLPAPNSAPRLNFMNGEGKPLTAREHDVMELLCHGAPNKSIAEKLGVSESTVKLHIHNIIDKLGVNNRTEAAVYYLTSGAANAPIARDEPSPR